MCHNFSIQACLECSIFSTYWRTRFFTGTKLSFTGASSRYGPELEGLLGFASVVFACPYCRDLCLVLYIKVCCH